MLLALVLYLILLNTLGVIFLVSVVVAIATGRLHVEFVPLTRSTESVDDTPDEYEQLTPLEIERIRDMQNFDARIAHMKDEMARANFKSVRESPVVPQEFDGVKNIPHHAVNIRQTTIDEVAD